MIDQVATTFMTALNEIIMIALAFVEQVQYTAVV